MRSHRPGLYAVGDHGKDHGVFFTLFTVTCRVGVEVVMIRSGRALTAASTIPFKTAMSPCAEWCASS